MSMTRSRWAAIGAAVAVTLGAGGIGLVNATNPSGATTYVPISPCRLDDTRGPSGDAGLGGRETPLGPNETFTLDTTGGQCTGIPAGATGITMNVTSVSPTAPTFLTIWPAGETWPLASSLNPFPGEPPTPNGVEVELNANNEFSVFNLAGSVDVIFDITGFYIDHDHDDRYAPAAAYGVVNADGTVAPGTVGVAASGVTHPSPGVYVITLAGGPFADDQFAVTATPACPGFTATAAEGAGGTLQVTITDATIATPAPADCAFSFSVNSLEQPAPTSTTTTSTSTTSSTTTTTVI